MRNLFAKTTLITLTMIAMFLPTTSFAKDWYMGGSVGYNQTFDQKSQGASGTVDTEFDAGIVTTSLIGLKYNNNLRVEGEFSWRRNDGDSLAFNGNEQSFAAKGAQSYGAMVNVFYDAPNDTSFTPYVGGGIGFDYIENEFLYQDINFEDSDTVFAWQIAAGVSTPLTKKIDGFIDVRYHVASSPDFVRTSSAGSVSLSSEYDNISVSIGYRYNFGG